jgi:hypothetical protein
MHGAGGCQIGCQTAVKPGRPYACVAANTEFKGVCLGGPAGNRTWMTGLEDPIRRCLLHSAPIGGCRSSGMLAPHMSVLCRQVARLVVGYGGRTGGISTYSTTISHIPWAQLICTVESRFPLVYSSSGTLPSSTSVSGRWSIPSNSRTTIPVMRACSSGRSWR